MTHDDLDRILSREEEIVPSSGFASSVMESIRSQATAPPPIAFPWKRALPGLAGIVCALVWLVVAGISEWRHPSPAAAILPPEVMTLLASAKRPEMLVTGLSLLLTLFAMRFAIDLGRGSS